MYFRLESSGTIAGETQPTVNVESSDAVQSSENILDNSVTKVTFDNTLRSEGLEEGNNYERKQKFKQEPLKTLLSGLFLGTGFLASTFSLTVTHDRYPETDPLPDVVFEIVKYQPWGLMASEYLLLFLLYTAVFIVLLHNYRLIILRRIWFLLGILYYFRALTMFVTVLPKSDETYTCLPKSNSTTSMGKASCSQCLY